MLVNFMADEHYAFSKLMRTYKTRNVISNCSRQHYIRKKMFLRQFYSLMAMNEFC